MRCASRFIPLLSLLLIILLVIYAIGTVPSILRKDTSIAKLERNTDYYEGKEIILSTIPLEEVKENSIIVSDWDKKSKVEVSLADAPGGELKGGDIITVVGTSYLKSKGYVEAREIHIHENYFLRMYVSPIGLVFLLLLMHRDRIIRRIYA
ncbi:Uncharacterised protein [uncultured archaeon]|nr:Uncharacterised protein [uncultured archaeon]